jgi:hypothetical protein
MSILNVKNIFVLAFLVLLGLLVYAPILNTTFFSDDFTVLYRLTKIDFNAGSFFRPLSDASIYFDYIFYGTRAFGFHVSSVLIHAATAFLCYLAALEFFRLTATDTVSHKFYAWLCGVLFLVYPFHSEAVVWVVGRGVLLATTFSVLSMIFYLKANGRTGYFLLAAFCYFTSLFGYESPVLLPLMVVIIEVLCKKWSRTSVRALGPYAVAAMVYLIVRFMQLGDIAGNHQYFSLSSSFGQLLLNALRLIERSILPPMQNSLGTMVILLVVLVVLSGLLIFHRKKWSANRHNKHMLAYVLLYAISLLPVITVGIDTHDTEGERFLYFPSLFFVLMSVYFLCVWFEKSRKTWIAAAVIFVYYLFFLEISVSNWVKAAGIIRNITAHPERYHTTGNLYIIDLPDDYRGAFIFRNGFEQAFRLQNQPLNVEQVIVLSGLHLNHTRHEKLGFDRTPVYDGKRFIIETGLNGDNILIKDDQTNKEYKSGPDDKVFFYKNENLHQLKITNTAGQGNIFDQ